MSDGNDVALIGVAGTLLGGVVGSVVAYVLTERAAINRETRADERLRSSVRLLVSIEADQNLDLFRRYWSEFRGPEAEEELRRTHGKNPNEQQIATFWARRLVNIPPPPWISASWSALTGSLTPALSANEIEEVSLFHNNLRAFDALRRELLEPAAETVQTETVYDLHGRPSSRPVFPWRFDHAAQRIWPRCEALVREILETGNPLSPSRTTEQV